MNDKIKELKARKQELGYSNKMVSDISGVPVSTLQKIFGGSTEVPRYETLLKIERALFPSDRDLKKYDPYSMPDGSYFRMYVEESAEAYKAESFYGYDQSFAAFDKTQGNYTVKDYLALPNDIRMELIDGILYDMGAPSTIHQMIVAEVSRQVSNVLDDAENDCISWVSPIDVQFEEADDSKDVIQPDFLIVCDKSKYTNQKGRIIGAPDFVMEVLSPSSRAKDRIVKLNKYIDKEVREYWIVDPETKEILVYFFEDSPILTHYNFEDRVPLRIFGGTISVSFEAITRKLERIGFDLEDTPT